jgi:hypothetical protein
MDDIEEILNSFRDNCTVLGNRENEFVALVGANSNFAETIIRALFNELVSLQDYVDRLERQVDRLENAVNYSISRQERN